MKLVKTLIGISFLVGCIFSCEKDDICSATTMTTPRIVIDFKDLVNRDDLKTVNNLRVRGLDENGNLLDVVSTYNATDVSQILLPLRSNVPGEATETKFQLYKDYEVDDNGTPDDTSDDFETGNPDIITISYSVTEVYVSAACGFKLQYNNVTLTQETDTDNWILLTEPFNDNLTITDENSTHYNIFH